MNDTIQLTFKQVTPLIIADLKMGQTPALIGEPGIGKTSWIRDLEKVNKTKTFILPVNQLADRADLTGVRMTQTESGKWQQESFPHSIIMEAIEYAEKHPDEEPNLLLDEFNRAGSDITSAILSFQTLRKIGNIKFPDNLRLIVAGNDKGNVTSLDSASITRFSLYHIIPDLETYLAVQEVNPFIRDVLTKHPDDLMATETVIKNNSDGDDEDDEDNEQFELAGLEFMVEESFKQKTNPRTITYTSEWLDAMGIDKSGSGAEKELLANMFTDMTSTSNGNVLLAGIVAHVGHTTFAYHLFDEIYAHFNSMLSTTQSNTRPKLTNLRPKQEFINSLSRADSVQKIEELIQNTSPDDNRNAVIWLTEIESVKEINNNDAVTSYMSAAPHNMSPIDNAILGDLMSVLSDAGRVSIMSVTAMSKVQADTIIPWKTMIDSMMAQH